jgi:cytochrome oxidase Cu insertion factor (SCO1/SenC/PrrC family)
VRSLDFCKIPLLFILIASIFVVGCAKEEPSVVGGKAADFSLKDEKGEAISLSQFQGQVVIIVFGVIPVRPTFLI